jgi:hypothetical protein
MVLRALPGSERDEIRRMGSGIGGFSENLMSLVRREEQHYVIEYGLSTKGIITIHQLGLIYTY